MADGKLSAREVQVLRLCAAGYSDKEIGRQLEISVYTVGHHVHRILRKLECANRAEAVAHGYRAGILPRPVEGSRTPAASTQGLVAVLPTGARSWRPELEGTTSRLVALLREALLNPKAWEWFLGELAQAFHSHLSLLTWVDYATPRMTSVTMSASMEPEWIRRYDEYYVRHYPAWDVMRQAPGDFFGATDDLDFPEGFTEGPFYREYMAAQNIARGIGWTVYVDETWVCTLFVGQSAEHGPTTPWERALGTALFPHVRHELRRLWSGGGPGAGAGLQEAERRELSAAEGAELMSASGRGLLVLDASGMPVEVNEVAESMIDSGTWLFRDDHGITAVDERATAILREALEQTLGEGQQTDVVPPVSLLFRAADPCRPPLRGTLVPAASLDDAGGAAGSPRAALILQELRVRPDAGEARGRA